MRHITPVAGHALEKLGHAIEYLSDEYVLCPAQDAKGQLDAIMLLMDRNRQVYFECRETVTLGRRIAAWLHR